MSKSVPIIKGVTGLNTVADPTRVSYDGETFLSDLIVAINITIDQTFRPSRRKGRELLQSGSFHSLFCDSGECLVMRGSTLYTVGSDYSLQTVISNLVQNTKISYAQHGNKIYFSNNYNQGIIENNTFSYWTKGTYSGPPTNKQFSGPPVGTHLGILSGRMLIADKNVLYYSELNRFDLFNIADNHTTLDSTIRMIKPVDTGVFVSSSKATYFLRGRDPKEWKLSMVAQFPATEWSVATKYIEGLEIGLQTPGLCTIWASPEGAILGTSDGQIINLTKEKVIYPETPATGAGCLIGYNYLHRMV